MFILKITFLGATRTVTGSNILIETKEKKFILDCGLYQGQDKEIMLNKDQFMFKPEEIDFMLLSHAHIDHSGRIPKLYVDGYRGPVYATKATVDLCGIMLPDSGYIQESEIEWLNRKRKREGKHEVPPVYTYEDAVASLSLFEKVEYNEIVQIDRNIKFRFTDAGHMLGSALVEVWITEDGKEQKLVFTGDLGNNDIPLLREPSTIADADILIMESTYGDRYHEKQEDKTKDFLDIVSKTLENGGNVVIPSFAVGRTQEILYELQKNKQNAQENALEHTEDHDAVVLLEYREMTYRYRLGQGKHSHIEDVASQNVADSHLHRAPYYRAYGDHQLREGCGPGQENSTSHCTADRCRSSDLVDNNREIEA